MAGNTCGAGNANATSNGVLAGGANTAAPGAGRGVSAPVGAAFGAVLVVAGCMPPLLLGSRYATPFPAPLAQCIIALVPSSVRGGHAPLRGGIPRPLPRRGFSLGARGSDAAASSLVGGVRRWRAAAGGLGGGLYRGFTLPLHRRPPPSAVPPKCDRPGAFPSAPAPPLRLTPPSGGVALSTSPPFRLRPPLGGLAKEHNSMQLNALTYGGVDH